MSRRLSMIPPALLLGVCLLILPACKKRKPTEEGGDAPAPAAGAAPVAVSSDHLVFARLNAKTIRDSALIGDAKQTVAKADWDKFDSDAGKDFGVKLTDIESATVAVADAPPQGEPQVIIILTSRTPFPKTGAFGLKADARPDSRGFYKSAGFTLIHFPDDKTAVAVSPELADKYLSGYAKDRTGWPLTADLTRAAADHALFAVVNMQKVPREALDKNDARDFGSVLSAQKVTLTADIRGKELSVGARATFPDAGTATKARDEVMSVVRKASSVIDEFAVGREVAELTALKPAVTEAQRAARALKVDVVGSDVTLSGSYKADFDIGQMVAEAIKKVQATAGRVTAQNNLKQIGLALHNYESTMGRLPIHATGANGAPLRNPTDKPLLSWRVAILPYIEQENLYKQFKQNEPWDSPNNIKLLKDMPKIFAPVEKPGKPGLTHLQMVVGPGGMPITGLSIAQIPDGTSNTIAVIETTDAVEWTKPADVMLPPKWAPGELKKKFGGQFAGGINVTMWDGSVRFIPDTVSERTLALLFDPRDGQVVPNDWLGAPPPPMGKK